MFLIIVPSICLGVTEIILRPYFPDGNLWFFSVFIDLCNDINFIINFVLGYSLAAADDQGLGGVIKRSRWYNLVIGNEKRPTLIKLKRFDYQDML